MGFALTLALAGFSVQSTTTPKKGGLNSDPERVFERIVLTAETPVPSPGATGQALRTQSLLFDLFSFDPAERMRDLQDEENK